MPPAVINKMRYSVATVTFLLKTTKLSAALKEFNPIQTGHFCSSTTGERGWFPPPSVNSENIKAMTTTLGGQIIGLKMSFQSHAFRVAVFDWQVFEFEPIRIVVTTSTEFHRQLTVLAACCSILCGIHSADETQPGRNSCPEFAFLAFSLDSIMLLSRLVFHFYVVSALQLLSLYFYFWLIRAVASSYVHQQHYRSRSLAFSFHFFFRSPCHEVMTSRDVRIGPDLWIFQTSKKTSKIFLKRN